MRSKTYPKLSLNVKLYITNKVIIFVRPILKPGITLLKNIIYESIIFKIIPIASNTRNSNHLVKFHYHTYFITASSSEEFLPIISIITLLERQIIGFVTESVKPCLEQIL